MAKSKAALDAAAPSDQSKSLDEIIKDVNKLKIYPGTQQNLYSFSTQIWGNYLKRLADFSNYRAAYTQNLGDEALKFIVDTEAMPSYEALRAEHSTARNQLVADNDAVLGMCRMLFDFIVKAYTVADQDAQLTAAGKGFYADASNFAWDKAATMIRMATTFMKDKGEKLMEKENMPAAFPEQFKLVADAFTAQRQLFKNKESEAKVGVLNKAAANNAIYSALKEMTDSAATIYRKDKLVMREFTIQQVLKTVRGNSISGIKGKVFQDEKRKKPLSNVLVYDQNDPEHLTRTDKEGRYELKFPSGTLTAVFEVEGFLPLEITKKINVGTMSPTSIVLSPVPVQVAPPAIVPPTGTASEMLNSAMNEVSVLESVA
jgi:hypothetical protein